MNKRMGGKKKKRKSLEILYEYEYSARDTVLRLYLGLFYTPTVNTHILL